jgi:pSer/pThr/pTyr-binding forkhead associated (FHA) protein
MEGALFCAECGAFLAEEDEQNTRVLPFSEFAFSPPPPPITEKSLPPGDSPLTVLFVLPSSRRRVKLTIENEITIGRASDDSKPDLDLEEDEGGEKGVSRLHAKIKWTAEGLVLIDLESTNGTLLNTYQLPPHRPYPLENGDEIRFGDLLMHIFY